MLAFAVFSAGCSGNSSASGGCRSHTYTYEDTSGVYGGGAGWYGYGYDDGWYDPGDDGSDYSDVGDGSGSSGDGTYYDDGSGSSGDGTYDDGSGSGGDGTYDDGTYDDGSGSDGTGSDGTTDDGSGSDGSGDDGSGDDGTASKKNLRLSSAKLHTQSGGGSGCYVYTCTLVCAVDSSVMRAARGASGVSQADACTTAEHGLENWAHDTLGRDIGACKQVANAPSSSSNAVPGSRTPASPSVAEGFSSTPQPPPVPPGGRSVATPR